MNVRKFRVPVRLAKMITAPGGKMVRDSMIAGQAAINSFREPCLATLNTLLTELVATCGVNSKRTYADVPRLFKIASDMLDNSTPVQDLQIDLAAHSLCRLADAFDEAGRADWKAVDVHIEVLRFLLATNGAATAAARTKMTKGLNRVVDRVALTLEMNTQGERPEGTAGAR